MANIANVTFNISTKEIKNNTLLPKSADTAKTSLNFETKNQNINPRQILGKVT